MSAPAASGPRRRPARAIGLYVGAALIVVGALLPLLWVLKMSLVTRAELFSDPPTLLPQHVTFDNFSSVLDNRDFRRGLLNSFIIAGATTALAVGVGSLAAYPLARLQFRFRTLVMTGILAISFFPTVAIIAPLFIEFRRFDLLDSYWAVILADTVFVLPLAVWIIVAFFRQLPPDLEQAAKIDGATAFQAFRHVIVPLAAPGVFTAALLTFIFSWNEFLFANTFLFNNSQWPATVVIPNFATTHTVDYGAQAAASLVVTLPVVALVLLFQRRIVSGLTAGAVTG